MSDEYNTAQWVREHHQNPFEVNDRILRLLIQRDEAREQTRYQYNRAEALEVERDDAEAAGYQRAIEDVVRELETSWAHIATPELRNAILALLEQSDDANAMRKK